MSGKLIIIEAGDGCGKATQAEKLYNRLKSAHHMVRKVEFPNYQSQSSALIKMYLNGDFGSQPNAVNPYAASAFYAVDRYASYKQEWESFYQQGGIIIADRYTTSNMVHQAVKITDDRQREEFLDWLWDLEFGKFALPVPDAVIFLDVPPAFSGKLILERAKQAGAGRADIHEQDEAYLARCYDSYSAIAAKYGWHKIDCVNGEGLKPIAEIHEEVFQVVSAIIAK